MSPMALLMPGFPVRAAAAAVRQPHAQGGTSSCSPAAGGNSTWGEQLLAWSASFDNWDEVAAAQGEFGWRNETLAEPCLWTGVACCPSACADAECCPFRAYLNDFYHMSWSWPRYFPPDTYQVDLSGWPLSDGPARGCNACAPTICSSLADTKLLC